MKQTAVAKQADEASGHFNWSSEAII